MEYKNRYRNGKIYKMEIDDLVYYGSTTQALAKRKSKHKSGFNFWKDNDERPYLSSYELFKLGDPTIILVEKYPCNSKEELFARESYYIKNNDCINKKMPNRNKGEYYEENKDIILQRVKKYYNDNKKDIIEKQKKYYHENKENVLVRMRKTMECKCGMVITRSHIRRHENSQFHINKIYMIDNEGAQQIMDRETETA